LQHKVSGERANGRALLKDFDMGGDCINTASIQTIHDDLFAAVMTLQAVLHAKPDIFIHIHRPLIPSFSSGVFGAWDVHIKLHDDAAIEKS
jgi:hypothetical protein